MSPATEGLLAAAELRLHEVMSHVRPKHRAVVQAQASGDLAALAACEADLSATMPFVSEARNAVAATRGATMQVAAGMHLTTSAL